MKKGKNLLKRGMALILSFLMVVSVIPTDGIKIAKAAVTDTTSVSYAIISGTNDAINAVEPTSWTSTNATLTEALNAMSNAENKTLYVKLNGDINEKNYGKTIRLKSKFSFANDNCGFVLDLAGKKIDRSGMTPESGKNSAIV
ncbi:MAG: hypothetical protein PUK26_05255, partial [Lachnoclostridium sp.]|nr:hypothetical protein [Lachnoclostridium sp.]